MEFDRFENSQYSETAYECEILLHIFCLGKFFGFSELIITGT